MDAIPVVDFEDLRSPRADRRRRSGLALRAALCELGFVRVEGHGVDDPLIHRVTRHFESFFAREEAEKLVCAGVAGGQRGFTSFGVEHARDQGQPDLKEFFHVGQERSGVPGAPDGSPAQYPANVWPEGAGGLREDAVQLFRALESCAVALLEALAESFDLPRATFASMVVGGNSILRALHYPPVSPPVSRSGVGTGAPIVRAAAHEDIDLLTLLCEATDAGLEIRPPGARHWIPVEVAPGEIVADSGDMLARLTNDVVPATTHRVVAPPDAAGRHRYALPFFAHPRPECDLSVLDRFVGPERARRHAPITAGGYLAERLREIGLAP